MSKSRTGPIGQSSRIATKSAALAIEKHERFSYTLLTVVPLLYTADMIIYEQPLYMAI